MPYVNKPRPYKKEWKQQQDRNEKDERATRERARYHMDKAGVNRNGKDIDHIKPLSKGGTNSSGNLRLVTPSKNRSFKRNSDGSVKKNASNK